MIKRGLLTALGLAFVVVVVLNWTYGRLPAEPPPGGAFVQVGSLRIHYLEHPGRGVPVLLLHGLPGTADDFDAVTAELRGRRTIAIDRPGYGYSSAGYAPFAQQLHAISGVIRALHLGRPILVGHSYGGTLALAFAERHPRQVSGLLLVDAAAAGLRPSTFSKLRAHVVQAMELPVVRQIANATFSQLALTLSADQGDGEAFDPQPVAPAHRHRLLEINMTHSNLEAYAGEELAAGGVESAVDRGLHAMRTPAVVVQGDHDQLVDPIYGRRLAAALPDARLVMVSGGHMVPYTHPAAVAEAVRSLTYRRPAASLWPGLRRPPAARSGA